MKFFSLSNISLWICATKISTIRYFQQSIENSVQIFVERLSLSLRNYNLYKFDRHDAMLNGYCNLEIFVKSCRCPWDKTDRQRVPEVSCPRDAILMRACDSIQCAPAHHRGNIVPRGIFVTPIERSTFQRIYPSRNTERMNQ